MFFFLFYSLSQIYEMSLTYCLFKCNRSKLLGMIFLDTDLDRFAQIDTDGWLPPLDVLSRVPFHGNQ